MADQPKIERPKFGDLVTATHMLSRGSEFSGRAGFWRKEWIRRDWKVGDYSGRYIGYRTYNNGTVNYQGDDGSLYEADEWFEVWLLVKDERSAPFAVLPGDCVVAGSNDGN